MARYKFDHIAHYLNEKRMPTEADRETYIGLEHLDSGSLTVTRWGSDVDIKGQKLVMHKGDILFGRRNTYLKRAAIAPHDGLFSAHGMIWRPKEDVVDAGFFPFFVSSDYFMDEAIRISVGSLSPTINWRDLKELEFNLPDIDTQRKLSILLWAMERTKTAYRKLIAKTDELVKSQFVEMFGHKTYPVRRLGDVCLKITDGTHKTPQYLESGITFISAKNVVNGYLDFSDVKYISKKEYYEIQKRCNTEYGDVLLTKSGSLGTPAIVDTDEPLGLFESLAVLKYDRRVLDGVFLCEQIKGVDLQKQLTSGIKGVAVKHLHLNVIAATKIIVPPLAEQKVFATFVEQADKSKFAAQQALADLTATQKALMRQYLS